MRFPRPTISLSLPIRFKIAALIVAALATSLGAYLYAGTSLLVSDKVSYIYDFNLAGVKSASDQVESRIVRLRTTLEAAAALIHPSFPEPSKTAVEQFFAKRGKTELGAGFLVLRPDDRDHFKLELQIGAASGELVAAMGQLGWTPAQFEKAEILTAPGISGKFPVGFRMVDAAEQPVVAVSFFEPSPEFAASLFRDAASKFRMRLVDSLGKPLIVSEGFAENLDLDAAEKPTRELFNTGFPSGVQEWSNSGENYVVAYQKVPSVELLVMGMIPKNEAFKAAEILIKRSVVLGVSILLIAVAGTLVFARSLTQRLREMWFATQKVSQGDFSTRVKESESGDEINGLAKSFNVMAEKVQTLIAEQVEKVRMETELMTAQTIQSRFFPQEGYNNRQLQISGLAIPATECAGDWWHYSTIGHYMIVAVGDVTGHGVSSALVTAAAHGAFAVVVEDLRLAWENERKPPSVELMTKKLNAAVYSAAGGETTMTMVISVIDMATGRMLTVNAANRPPYLLRKKSPEDPGTIKPLMDGSLPTLGFNKTMDPVPLELQLQPGDRIFWFTDGLVECENSEGNRISKSALVNMIKKSAAGADTPASQTCEILIQEYKNFLQERVRNPDDDTTLVVGTVPFGAQLISADLNKAA